MDHSTASCGPQCSCVKRERDAATADQVKLLVREACGALASGRGFSRPTVKCACMHLCVRWSSRESVCAVYTCVCEMVCVCVHALCVSVCARTHVAYV